MSLENLKMVLDVKKKEDERSDRISTYYTSANSALFSIYAVLGNSSNSPFGDIKLLSAIPLIGWLLCLSWLLALSKIRQKNKAK